MGDEDVPTPPQSHPAVGSSDGGNLAPTASITLQKLKEDKRALMQQRDQLRTELNRLLDSVAAPAPGPSAVPACPHSYSK